MKYTCRNRHCITKEVDGKTRLYAVYGKEEVEVNKEVYDYLKRSYEREWTLEKIERKHKGISYEQLLEDIDSADRHGKTPPKLCRVSAETEYFDETYEKVEQISFICDEVRKLSPNNQMIFETFLSGTDGVFRVSQLLGISERTVYNRRQRLAKQVGMKLSEGYEE